ncbi:MAG: DUF6485 family protein [Thermodesulfovibrionales bacterium]|nr:DUF6485 family protein [Thermodesulfovibrionales bacterium]
MDCPKIERNKKYCTCSYEPCSKKFRCCDCLHYHRQNGELPACFFSPHIEKTYDRSIRNFIKNFK